MHAQAGVLQKRSCHCIKYVGAKARTPNDLCIVRGCRQLLLSVSQALLQHLSLPPVLCFCLVKDRYKPPFCCCQPLLQPSRSRILSCLRSLCATQSPDQSCNCGDQSCCKSSTFDQGQSHLCL